MTEMFEIVDINMGTFALLDKLVLELDGKKAWIFHGDVFLMHHFSVVDS
jgi:UDP-2,3-diacylglucosamine pyrophosphatase LpxH